MKKVLIFLILAFISTTTMAEWTKVREHVGNNGYTIYADLDTLRKVSNKAKMWVLLDYQNEQKASGTFFFSKKIRRQYDCVDSYMRVLAFKLYSRNMGRGELIRSYPQPQKWQRVKPDSIDQTEWEVVCNNE